MTWAKLTIVCLGLSVAVLAWMNMTHDPCNHIFVDFNGEEPKK